MSPKELIAAAEAALADASSVSSGLTFIPCDLSHRISALGNCYARPHMANTELNQWTEKQLALAVFRMKRKTAHQVARALTQ